jgi:hypothetical protein
MMVHSGRRLRALLFPKKYFSTPATSAAAASPATPPKPAEPVPTKIYGGLKDQDRIFTNLYGEQVYCFFPLYTIVLMRIEYIIL